MDPIKLRIPDIKAWAANDRGISNKIFTKWLKNLQYKLNNKFTVAARMYK